MKSKTLALINHYHKVLKEQTEDGSEELGELEQGQSPDVTENPDPAPQEEMPLTSEGEEEYISNLVDAALFSPSAEDSKTLTDLQSAIKLKRFTNAREEILPIVLGIIRPTTDGGDLKQDLNQL